MTSKNVWLQLALKTPIVRGSIVAISILFFPGRSPKHRSGVTVHLPRALRRELHVEVDFNFVFGSDAGYAGRFDPEVG